MGLELLELHGYSCLSNFMGVYVLVSVLFLVQTGITHPGALYRICLSFPAMTMCSGIEKTMCVPCDIMNGMFF
jgi:hypothetical protein